MKPPESNVTRLQNEVVIRRLVPEVYRYVTTPGHWPEWHTASLRVGDEANHPLPAGSRFESEILAASVNALLNWVVQEAHPNQLFVVGASSSIGVALTIRYDFTECDEGTRFTRTLDYSMPNAFMRFLNWLLLKRRMEKESRESMKRLKHVMETGNIVMD